MGAYCTLVGVGLWCRVLVRTWVTICWTTTVAIKAATDAGISCRLLMLLKNKLGVQKANVL